MAERKETTVWINELHYEDFGWDENEGVEVAGPAGTNLNGWKLTFYDGSGKPYKTTPLKGRLPNLQAGMGTLFFYAPYIHNGKSGVCLSNKQGDLVQFLSYEGQITGAEGIAAGVKSENLPVKESGFSSRRSSLQLQGQGNVYEDFAWTGPIARNPGGVNSKQKFVRRPTSGPFSIEPHLANNKKRHHTEEYELDYLVVRRGFEFTIKVSFPGDDVELILKDIPDKENAVTIPVTKEAPKDKSKPYAYYTEKAEHSGEISLCVPSDYPIGIFSLKATSDGQKTEEGFYIIVMFNPWNDQDSVYMEDEKQRYEYVLEDNGLIWVGSANHNGPRAWNFAQFSAKSVLASMRLLWALPYAKRNDPIIVCRHMSAMVNSNDEDGVLVGNWSGKYDDGTSPSQWTGSEDILDQYYVKEESVKYGQCWVFSGVLTTVCRAIGIPCRSVTNFDSAHDTNMNRTVDKFYDADYNADASRTSDSIWNFHVWNDVFMKRPDIGNEYNGWQALDATPQERSEGIYKTGPCPLVGIKEGDKNVKYDSEFIYAEVNADINHYLVQEDGSTKLIKKITSHVGKQLSTKQVGRDRLNEITDQYKHTEGTKEERAAHQGGEEGEEGELDVSMTVGKAVCGETVSLSVTISKRDGAKPETRRADVSVHISVVSYTGKAKEQVLTKNAKMTISDTDTFTVNIEEKTYRKFLDDDCYFQAWAVVKFDTDEMDIVTKDFDFEMPEVVVTADGDFVVGKKTVITVTATNPLDVPLTDVTASIEGARILHRTLVLMDKIAPHSTGSCELSITPTMKGEKNIAVSIESKELIGMNTFLHVDVI